ncbi:MAG: MauE/DoxX family redox-associated membrane protein [Thermodesulfobacteriota bacterium]|nr:MauE/DoxX family redox-associated membrane protein [Thermodesulfobacteriota bacterium]
MKWPSLVPRLLAAALGLFFVAASLSKALDVALFIRQITAYGIISDSTFVTFIAWGLIAVECTLGVGLMVFYRPRLFLGVAAGLLLFFWAITSWAWWTGSTENCGCLGGWMDRTPGEEAVENIVLLLVTLFAARRPGHLKWQPSRARAWAVVAAGLVGLALPVASGLPTLKAKPLNAEVKTALSQLALHGPQVVDLTQGTHLVVLMSTDCLHCQEAVLDLNALGFIPDLPPVVALCTNAECECEMFVEEFQPDFPIGCVTESLFFELLGDGDIPRILLLSNGHVLQAWDQTVPEEEMIRAHLPLLDGEDYLQADLH